MNRKDHILALALRQNNHPKESPSSADATDNSTTPRSQGTPSGNKPSVTPPYINSPPYATPLDVTPPRVHYTRTSLLCYENIPFEVDDLDLFDDYDSDDSAKDKDYIPETAVIKKTHNLFNDFDTEDPAGNANGAQIIVIADIHIDPNIPKRSSQKSSATTVAVSKPDNVPTESDDIIVLTSSELATQEFEAINSLEQESTLPPSNEKGFTKSGIPRKRRKYDVTLSERLIIKKKSDDEKLSMKPPCDDKCRRKCTSKIITERRQDLHDKYINLNYEARGIYIKSMIETYAPRVRKVASEERKIKRNNSHRFYFVVNEARIEVCKKYFLTTLGYHSNNNRRIMTALNNDIDEQKDKRGTYKRTIVIDKDIIRAHIETYNPMISHYRREHAPNKLYLPSDINITMMHQNFTEKYPDMTVSFETYRKTVRNMNISFTHLGNEECEECALFKIHKDSSECTEEPCENCVQYTLHKKRYKTARKEYKKDKTLILTEKDRIYYSVDLQKVIMLPRMDQYKTAIFCPRIIAFNESFVPLGKLKDHENMPYAVLWNETISGRRQEDIISAFRAFFIRKRDCKEIIIWADNCAAQNKNWALLSFLVNIINSQLIFTESITIKYFEPGHTFMSADHFHHQVEQSMSNKKIYDYQDFIDVVKKSNSQKNEVKTMSVSDFYIYKDKSSTSKIKSTEPRVYLKNIMSVKAEKGEFTIKYKECHEGEWKTLDFLLFKIVKERTFPEFSSRQSPRGITKERKEEIVSKLLPLMPENRRCFWNDLPVSNNEQSLD